MKLGAAGALVTASRASLRTGPEQATDDKQFHGLRVGAASYSLRRFSLDQALAATQRMGIHYISLKDVHLPVTSTADQIAEAKRKTADYGITITSCGVLYLKDSDDDMRRALDYVHALGASVAVVGVSRQMLPRLNQIIANYDLKAAIHNHGPGDKLFPSPLEVFDAVQSFDRKIGLCMDLGHTFRLGEDLVSDVRKTRERLYSMHFKDLDSRAVKAKGVPVGMGVMPIIPLLRELLTMHYKGEVQLEYEVEENDPVPGMEESFGFMRGVLQTQA
jgi:sugar phosphate isomerase/epimerase